MQCCKSGNTACIFHCPELLGKRTRHKCDNFPGSGHISCHYLMDAQLTWILLASAPNYEIQPFSALKAANWVKRYLKKYLFLCGEKKPIFSHFFFIYRCVFYLQEGQEWIMRDTSIVIYSEWFWGAINVLNFSNLLTLLNNC